MENSPLVRLFRTFSKTELRQLRKFVRSPFFNQRDDVIRLFGYLEKNVDQSGAALSKDKAFSSVFPRQAYDDSLMRYAMSFLLETLREFLIWSELNREDFNRQIYLARSLRRRGLEEQFQKTIAQAQTGEEKTGFRHADFHFRQYLLRQENYELKVRQKRSGEMGLQEQTDHLSAYFAGKLLRQACGIATHQTMTRQEYDIPLLAEVLQLVEAGKFSGIPAVQLYFYAYRAQESPANEQHFRSLTELLESHWQAFPTAEARDLFLLAINFCIKKINGGEAAFRRDVFGLYRSGLEKAVLLDDGTISPFTYNNVLNSALLVGEWNWAADFLEQYKSRLPAAGQENTYHFNLANLFFRKKEYDKAMELLRQVDFKDKLHNLDARRMLLRMYFETGEFDALESLLDSFETYIRRQKDLGYHGENYLNLIRLTRKLLQLPPGNKMARQQFAIEIAETKSLAEREWLLEMGEKYQEG